MLLTLLVRNGNYRVLQSKELISPILVVRKPSLMIPFPRDRMFVGREAIMADINRRYEQGTLQSHTRLALVGLGGVG
jgi:hypothetical protein